MIRILLLFLTLTIAQYGFAQESKENAEYWYNEEAVAAGLFNSEIATKASAVNVRFDLNGKQKVEYFDETSKKKLSEFNLWGYEFRIDVDLKNAHLYEDAVWHNFVVRALEFGYATSVNNLYLGARITEFDYSKNALGDGSYVKRAGSHGSVEVGWGSIEKDTKITIVGNMFGFPMVSETLVLKDQMPALQDKVLAECPACQMPQTTKYDDVEISNDNFLRFGYGASAQFGKYFQGTYELRDIPLNNNVNLWKSDSTQIATLSGGVKMERAEVQSDVSKLFGSPANRKYKLLVSWERNSSRVTYSQKNVVTDERSGRNTYPEFYSFDYERPTSSRVFVGFKVLWNQTAKLQSENPQ